MVDKIKNNVLNLSLVAFGDVLCEILINRVVPGYQPDKTEGGVKRPHDGWLKEERVEIKFCRAMDSKVITEDNAHEILTDGNVISFKDSKNPGAMCCFFNDLKVNHFDILFYGIFFNDNIYIFKANIEDIIKDDEFNLVGHRDRQQFGIRSKKKLNYHIENYLYQKISWNEFSEKINA